MAVNSPSGALADLAGHNVPQTPNFVGRKDSSSSLSDKPLPAPPTDAALQEQEPPTWGSAALPALNNASHEPKQTATSPAPSAARLKKKVPWKGKNIMVLLPMDNQRGQPGNAPMPLTMKDVEAMQREWEQLGYNISGFDLGFLSDDLAAGQGQSRDVWPDSHSVEQERQSRQFQVSIPDRRHWDAYVKELSEAKLRALGVSSGDEDTIPPPAPAELGRSLSRSVSMQYPGLPFSPPIPTSSAVSTHATQHPNAFSPLIIGAGANPSINQVSSVGSIPSPATVHAQMFSKFNPRQSISFNNGDHPFGSPFQYPQQPSPTVWPPQTKLFQQGMAQGPSPSLSILGPMISPLQFRQDGYFPQNDMCLEVQQRQHQIHEQIQQLARKSPSLQDRQDVEHAGQQSPSKTPEAYVSRNLNANESLQKEIDDAEYHLEEQISRQLEHDDYSPHSEKANNADRRFTNPLPPPSEVQKASKGGLAGSRFATSTMPEGPELHHPQPHSRGHSLSQQPFDREDAVTSSFGLSGRKLDLSDIDTNPSSMGTPDFSSVAVSSHQKMMSHATNPWLDSDTGSATKGVEPNSFSHASQSSNSKLNVEAPEFKFDPSSSFKPGQFSFGGSAFLPSAPSFAPVGSSHRDNQLSTHSIMSSADKVNASAPAFTPGYGDFSFSSTGPTFRPDAPAFTPLIGKLSESIGSALSISSETPVGRIFGKIDMADVIKPPKKSKAIPIIRPDSSAGKSVEPDTCMGEDGRATQGESRIKRARGTDRDADSVPLFAEPSMPLQETNREQSPPKESTPRVFKVADKENTIPAEDAEAQIIQETAVTQDRSRSLLENPPDYDGESWAPWDFEQQKQAEDFSAASAFPVREPNFKREEANGTNNSEDAGTEGASKPKKQQKRNSLSTLAKPFGFGSLLNFGGNAPSTPSSAELPTTSTAEILAPASVPAVTQASKLSADVFSSRYADMPETEEHEGRMGSMDSTEIHFQAALPQQTSPKSRSEFERAESEMGEPTFEEIDAVMYHMNKVESAKFASREMDTTPYDQPSPRKPLQIPDTESSPNCLQSQIMLRSDTQISSGRHLNALSGIPAGSIFTHNHDDPFIDRSDLHFPTESPIHNLNNGGSQSPSNWDDVISESEDAKFRARGQFFDHHVNELVGGLIDEKLDPMERALEAIQESLSNLSARAPSLRAQRSMSAELPESDADDEDDELHRHSLSPRKDRKMEKIRSIVVEAIASHKSLTFPEVASVTSQDPPDVMKVLEDMQAQFGQSMRLDLGEDLRPIVEEAIHKCLPTSLTARIEESANAKVIELDVKIAEMTARLESANKKMEEEIEKRRATEDCLADVKRLLRISSEEEDRLRGSLAEQEQKLKNIEGSRTKSNVHTALLEANAGNGNSGHNELLHRLASTENDLRETRREAQHWHAEAERVSEVAKRHGADSDRTKETNISLRLAIDRIKLQMEESLHTRESMRRKLEGLQQGMADAAHEVSQENARRAKKDQELIARHEILDARLQAEARTRERLEQEIARLEQGEREGMRAVNESKRLEAQLLNLRNELDEAETNAMRFKREFEEARESGLSEVQRTRKYMQIEVDAANNQVNFVRQDLEDQISRLRTDLDNAKLDADTAKAKHEMLFEEAMESKQKEIEDLDRRHANEIDDIETQHARQLTITVEDAARSEQLLLERLSLSSAKTEHLQDRVTHLEEKLEIAKTAAHAAAQAARSPTLAKSIPQTISLPEKVSPQALRESIIVLQEQLQDRERTIETLEQRLAIVDEDAPAKISKRDDEIIWLRELLAVRIGDLQDIISTLSQDDFDPAAVKDAAVRLKANLQMEEQERERAMNGASAISLPNIAATIREAASPRVAQVVGPMAAVWGNWRKAQVGSLAEIMSNSSTPVKPSPSRTQGFLSGLMTPPSNSRTAQPLAFGNTGKRFTAQELANRPPPIRPSTRRQEKMPEPPELQQPSTPPIMKPSSYDQDAEAGDFSDAGFYDDDESTVDDGIMAR